MVDANTDIISIGSIKFKHFDLAQAIMKYDAVNSNTNKKSIQLISTLNNKSISRNRKKRVVFISIAILTRLLSKDLKYIYLFKR